MNGRIGQQIGNYRLSRLLGQGGFAEVYLGEHLYLRKQAAFKFLNGKLSAQDVQDFRQEAQTLTALKHPHIIHIDDFGMEQMVPYIVMEYAPHGTLRDRHPRGSIVPLPQLLLYVKQVGAALAYTHEHKLIHRDVKPENMLLNEQKQVLLSDFGIVAIAHSTASMQTQNGIGTAHYMAPEQLRGYPTPASDQYSLGVVVYEWVCGTRPFTGANIVEIGMKHATEPVPSLKQRLPGLSPDVERVVLRALEKDEKQRFPQIQDFVQALEQAMTYVAPVRISPQMALPTRPEQIVLPARPVPSEQTPPSLVAVPSEQLPPRHPAPRGVRSEQALRPNTPIKEELEQPKVSSQQFRQVQQLEPASNDRVYNTSSTRLRFGFATFVDAVCLSIALSLLLHSRSALVVVLLGGLVLAGIATVSMKNKPVIDQTTFGWGVFIFSIAWCYVGWLFTSSICTFLSFPQVLVIIVSILGAGVSMLLGLIGYFLTLTIAVKKEDFSRSESKQGLNKPGQLA